MVKVVAQLALAFSFGAAAIVAAQASYKKLRATTTASQQRLGRHSQTNQAPGGSDEMQQALLEEQLSRIRTFFGKEGYENIANAFVIVVGVGGVGSHAAHMLARSGVGRLRLIDFDNVTLSSLNRHAVATRADVGIPKVTAMKRHLHEIVPHCQIEAIPMMFDASCADELLAGQPTFVLDCIDDVTTKLALLEAVTRKGLKAITSMGAGGKSDPTRLQIGTLSDVVRDPLATKIRYFLRKRDVAGADDITTVYSSEKTVATLLPLDASQAQSPQDFGSVERMRIRVIPVLGTMPALFGQTMAAYVLCSMGNALFSPECVSALSRDQRNKLYHCIQNREKKPASALELDKDELDFIYMEIWRGRSAISGTRQGGHERLYLARWRPERPLRPDNIVYLTTKELEQLDKHGVDSFPSDVVTRIDERLRSFGAWSM